MSLRQTCICVPEGPTALVIVLLASSRMAATLRTTVSFSGGFLLPSSSFPVQSSLLALSSCLSRHDG